MTEIILYDLPSRGHCASWSLNPWKTRLALNFKGLDYKTRWVEYPDIEPLFKSFGIAPNASGPAAYTIPAVKLGGAYTMDSAAIAPRIESLAPSPSLHLDSPYVDEVSGLIGPCMEALRPLVMPLIPAKILNPVSAEFFDRTRKERFGMSLKEFGETRGGEPAWREAEGPLKKLGEVLHGEEGPYSMGQIPSYADLIIVAFLHFTKVGAIENFNRIVQIDPAFGKLYEACTEWLKRDDH